MYAVITEKGKKEDFRMEMIVSAVKSALDSAGAGYEQEEADFLALKVTARFQPIIREGLVTTEGIRLSVAEELAASGYDDAALAYISGCNRKAA